METVLTERQAIDTLWVVVASGMVFFMQLGFLCLEIGLVQAKNAIDIAVKNVADFVITSLVFYAVGFGLMFGHSWLGIFGISDFFLSGANANATFLGAAFIFMQVCFAGCAVTIIAGATMERSDLTTHLIISAVIAGIIYPVFGHWVWGNLFYGEPNGWLVKLGFIDFAGSSVVHGVGGWVTLAAIIAIGPRQGRYGPNGEIRSLGGNNIPMAALGTFILWFGWFGFNGGSLLKVSADVGGVILKTNFAAAAGGLTSYLYAKWRQPHAGLQALPTLAGTLGGMVAITAGSFAVPLWASLIIGGIAGVVVNVAQEFLDRMQWDDPVGAVPVHAVCGTIGTILTGVFATPNMLLVSSGNRLEQIGIQILGSVACFMWSFGVGWLAFKVINKFHPIRVTPEQEQRGLNITEFDDVWSWLDHRKTQRYESTVSTLNQLVEDRTKALQLEHDRLDTVLNSMADGLIVTNGRGTIMLANPAFLMMTNAATSTVGQHIGTVINQSALLHIIEQAVVQVGKTFSTRFMLNNHHYHASAHSVELGDLGGAVTILRDVTSEVQAEQSRLDFVSNVSHELRTPLTSVVGFAKMLRHLFVDELQPNIKVANTEVGETLQVIKDDLDILAEESERLNRLINDVLDLSRMDSGSLNWQMVEVNLKDLVNQMGILFNAAILDHSLELMINTPDEVPVIAADSDRLKQVLTNFVSNAIKFTPKGGTITLEVQVVRRGDCVPMWPSVHCPEAKDFEWQLFGTSVNRDWVLMSVTDTGVGIEEKELPVVFERFGQAGELMTDKPSGTGLGLAICHNIVRYLKGYLWVESEVGKGSRFTAALPV